MKEGIFVFITGEGEDQGKYVTFSTVIHTESGENLEMTTSCAVQKLFIINQ